MPLTSVAMKTFERLVWAYLKDTTGPLLDPCSLPTEQTGLLSESLVQPSPVSKNCTHPEWVKGLAKSLWTGHIQHTPSLNCYLPVDTTELWAPERPDTETTLRLSFPKQSISWTLYIKRGTHNTIIHYLFTTHSYCFNLKFAHTRPMDT